MSAFDALRSALVEFRSALPADVTLIVSGGYGLYLWQEEIRRTAARTLLSSLPEPRATNDIDVFVGAADLANLGKMTELRRVLEKLDYQAVPEAKFMQWRRSASREQPPRRDSKLDFLVAAYEGFEEGLRVKGSRVRPKASGRKSLDLHAFFTPEAVGLEENCWPLEITASIDGSTVRRVEVALPHPFSYLVMKLVAFDDVRESERKDLGRHHALDVYRIAAMTNEEQYDQTLRLAMQYRDHESVVRARGVVEASFASSTSIGSLRLREHPTFEKGFPLDQFLAELRNLVGLDPASG